MEGGGIEGSVDISGGGGIEGSVPPVEIDSKTGGAYPSASCPGGGPSGSPPLMAPRRRRGLLLFTQWPRALPHATRNAAAPGAAVPCKPQAI
jgi:hypothetical protein